MDADGRQAGRNPAGHRPREFDPLPLHRRSVGALAQRREQPALNRSIGVRIPGASPRLHTVRDRLAGRTPRSERGKRGSNPRPGATRRALARRGIFENLGRGAASRAAPVALRRSSVAERPAVNRRQRRFDPFRRSQVRSAALASAARRSSARLKPARCWFDPGPKHRGDRGVVALHA